MPNVRSTEQADTSKISTHSDNTKRYPVPVYRLGITTLAPTTRTRHKESASAALPPISDTLPMSSAAMSQRSIQSNAYILSSINSERQNDSLILRGKRGSTHRYLQSNDTPVANNGKLAHVFDSRTLWANKCVL